MRLSKPQVTLFWRLWKGACAVQGWMADEQEARRKEILTELGFSSLKEVGREGDFDRLKARLLALQYRLEGGAGMAFPAVGDMRRHLHVIEARLLPRLAAHVDDPEAYVAAICADKFGFRGPWRDLGRAPDRGPGLVRQLLFTVTRAVRALEKRARQAKAVPPRLGGPKLDKPLINCPSEGRFGQIAPPDASGPVSGA